MWPGNGAGAGLELGEGAGPDPLHGLVPPGHMPPTKSQQTLSEGFWQRVPGDPARQSLHSDGEGLGDADGDGEGLGDRDGEGLGDGDGEGLGDRLGDGDVDGLRDGDGLGDGDGDGEGIPPPAMIAMSAQFQKASG